MIESLCSYEGSASVKPKCMKDILDIIEFIKIDGIKLQPLSAGVNVYEPVFEDAYDVNDFLSLFSEFPYVVSEYSRCGDNIKNRYTFNIPLDSIDAVIHKIISFKTWPRKYKAFYLFIDLKFLVCNGFSGDEVVAAQKSGNFTGSCLGFAIYKTSKVYLSLLGPVRATNDFERYSQIVSNVLRKPIEKIRFDVYPGVNGKFNKLVRETWPPRKKSELKE